MEDVSEIQPVAPGGDGWPIQQSVADIRITRNDIQMYALPIGLRGPVIRPPAPLLGRRTKTSLLFIGVSCQPVSPTHAEV